MDEYISREDVLDNRNIITVQTKEYGSIEVIPVDTIADIELADVQPARENYINVISERFRVSNYVQDDRKGYLLHDVETGQRQFIYTLTDVEDEVRIILEGERS